MIALVIYVQFAFFFLYNPQSPEIMFGHGHLAHENRASYFLRRFSNAQAFFLNKSAFKGFSHESSSVPYVVGFVGHVGCYARSLRCSWSDEQHWRWLPGEEIWGRGAEADRRTSCPGQLQVLAGFQNRRRLPHGTYSGAGTHGSLDAASTHALAVGSSVLFSRGSFLLQRIALPAGHRRTSVVGSSMGSDRSHRRNIDDSRVAISCDWRVVDGED